MRQRSLRLSTEHLVDLTADELADVLGASAGICVERVVVSGQPGCTATPTYSCFGCW